MEMKGIIEHSILGDDAEILLQEKGKYGGCGGGLNCLMVHQEQQDGGQCQI